jgi:hypothetical protein
MHNYVQYKELAAYCFYCFNKSFKNKSMEAKVVVLLKHIRRSLSFLLFLHPSKQPKCIDLQPANRGAKLHVVLQKLESSD